MTKNKLVLLIFIIFLGCIFIYKISQPQNLLFQKVDKLPNDDLLIDLTWLTESQYFLSNDYRNLVTQLSPNHEAFIHFSFDSNDGLSAYLLTKKDDVDNGSDIQFLTNDIHVGQVFSLWFPNGSYFIIGAKGDNRNCIINFYEYAREARNATLLWNTSLDCRAIEWDFTTNTILIVTNSQEITVLDKMGRIVNIINMPTELTRSHIESLTSFKGKVFVHVSTETNELIYTLYPLQNQVQSINCVIAKQGLGYTSRINFQLIWINPQNDCGLWFANTGHIYQNVNVLRGNLFDRGKSEFKELHLNQTMMEIEVVKIFNVLQDKLALQMGSDILLFDLHNFRYLIINNAILVGFDESQENLIIHQNNTFRTVVVQND